MHWGTQVHGSAPGRWNVPRTFPRAWNPEAAPCSQGIGCIKSYYTPAAETGHGAIVPASQDADSVTDAVDQTLSHVCMIGHGAGWGKKERSEQQFLMTEAKAVHTVQSLVA